MERRTANDEGFVDGRRPVGRRLRLRAPAKVNLHLEVLRRRHDGYHEIETVLQAVELFDVVEVALDEQWLGREPEIAIEVTGPIRGVPADETNLCWRAARLFCREQRVSGRLRLSLHKEIPAAAGLGGGSSDAAAVLVACDRLFATALDVAELERMGAQLGADVPFFVRGGTMLGRGIGTILTPLPTVRGCRFLILKPTMNLNTADVYGRLNLGLTVQSPKASIAVIKPILARFPQKTWPGFNRLEDVVLPGQPGLQRLVQELRESAVVAMLSGSGSAVYGVYPEGRDLATIAGGYAEAGLFVRVVGPHPGGVEITDD
jgi:4-diphosphocytidyl-2-C-methyl-D-erythritol kinase